MSAPEIRGWCPGALRPMASGDGLVARVRPRGGRLSAAQAAGLARAARAHGDGAIALSSRANLQLRGVTAQGHAALLADLAALDLLDADIGAEARRNIVVTPFWRHGDATPRLAAALAAALAKADAPETPTKFGFAVDDGPAPVLRAASADIRLERAVSGALMLRADGAATGCAVTEDAAPEAALALARWWLDSGGAPQGRGRMAAHLERGARLPARFDDGSVAAALAARAPAPAPGPCPQGFLAGVAFGLMSADTLTALAQAGAGLRLTPWRMALIEGAHAAPDRPEIIAAPDDPRLAVSACVGAPGCAQALAPTLPLAAALAARVPPGARLHVSGCAKGCAHPGPAAFTLVAGRAGFALIRDGRADAEPSRMGLSSDALIAHPETLFGDG